MWFWFLKLRSVKMADELLWFQFLDINKTKLIDHCHLEHSYGMTLASRTKRSDELEENKKCLVSFVVKYI